MNGPGDENFPFSVDHDASCVGCDLISITGQAKRQYKQTQNQKTRRGAHRRHHEKSSKEVN